MDWQEQLNLIPDRPGVYLMKSEEGDYIYIGKAISLKNRVRAYAQNGKNMSPKTKIMAGQIDKIDYIVTDTEVEALILESNLIKKHRPKYNINLKDDKHYPYIQVTVNEDFPRIVKARKVKKDGSRYFGPFADGGAVSETLDLIRGIFPVRDCRKDLTKNRPKRPCLNYYIKKCLAPCQGRIAIEEYQAIIREVLLFLEGRQNDLIRSMKKEMKNASDNLQYEKAAKLRDRIEAVEKIVARQKLSADSEEDRDVIALSRNNGKSCVQVFYVRDGKLMGRDQYFLAKTQGMDDQYILSAFLKQYYINALQIPKEILISKMPEDQEVVSAWLGEKRGNKVLIKEPKKGKKRDLLNMAEKNTQIALDYEDEKDRRSYDMKVGALTHLKEVLALNTIPHRIECYDVSNVQGKEAVGSMVVFVDGESKKKDYRRFQVKSVERPDDVAMMHEIISRRFIRLRQEEKKRDGFDHSFGATPDLIVVDGGKGQVNTAEKALLDAGFSSVPVIGLAKENEIIFRTDNQEPIDLPAADLGLRLLQRIRDEAHRFAVTYHRNLRNRRMVESILDEVPGVGQRRKTQLLKKFGSVEGIKKADPDEIKEMTNMSSEQIKILKDHLNARHR